MPPALSPTLVLYVYFGLSYEHDLRMDYFSSMALQADDDTVEYVFIHAAHPMSTRQKVHKNHHHVASIQLTSPCNTTWGAIGLALPQLNEIEKFKFIVVVDSFVMGPFIPPAIRRHMHWTTAFTSHLNENTALVGSIISCDGAPMDGNPSKMWRRNPYVGRHAFACDQSTLKMLQEDGAIFQCYPNEWQTRYHSDLGASKRILESGRNIASLMLRYAGIDWRRESTWNCNGGVRPYGAYGLYDGLHIAPYETLFVPMSPAHAKSYAELRPSFQYAEWHTNPVNITSNGFTNFTFETHNVRAEKMMVLDEYFGSTPCFDTVRYIEKNIDVLEAVGTYGCLGMNTMCGFDPYDHFRMVGVFEGRDHRWLCPAKLAAREDYRRVVAARGSACFDGAAYKLNHPEIEGELDDVWRHFLEHDDFLHVEDNFVCSETLYGSGAVVESLIGKSAQEIMSEIRADILSVADPLTPLRQREELQLENRKKREAYFGAIDAKLLHARPSLIR